MIGITLMQRKFRKSMSAGLQAEFQVLLMANPAPNFVQIFPQKRVSWAAALCFLEIFEYKK
nr:hypothetical protein [uncultured Cohaesibacter sp.]